MGTITISGAYQQMLQIDGPGTTINVSGNASIVGTAFGVYLTSTAINSTINVNGYVSGPSGAIYSLAVGAKVTVGSAAELSGTYGVALAGAGSSVVNKGEINSGAGYGIYDLAGAGNQITNSGEINAILGIVGTGDGGRIVNQAGGEIHGVTQGIVSSANADEHYTIINHGEILTALNGIAIASSSEDVRITNDGKISGVIILGAGDDLFDNRGGSYNTTLMGNIGDDTLIVDNAKYKLTEEVGEGTDTVKSTVSYKLSANVEKLVLLGNADIDGTGTSLADFLHGNSGNNDLKGLAGLDHLYGHKGNDRLEGGSGADYFHFSEGDGHDVILDMDVGTDWINIHDWAGIENFNQLKNHAQNQGNDVIIEQGDDSLLIKGFHKADLVMMDFVY